MKVKIKKYYDIMYDCQYGYYNDTKKDKEYFKKIYKAKGWSMISVTRTKTDTKGLKMYEITGIKYKED